MFCWVNGYGPRQYGFDFGVWTRQIVREVVPDKFDVALSLASTGALLARLDLTAQRSLQRGYQRGPQAISRWQRETCPAIVRQAKRDKAEIYCWGESAFRLDVAQGRA